MAKSNVPTRLERRRMENLYTSILVDVGVTYRHSLGEEVASTFLDTHGVPVAVAGRVLASSAQRRPTETERRLRASPQADLHCTSGHQAVPPAWLQQVRRRS